MSEETGQKQFRPKDDYISLCPTIVKMVVHHGSEGEEWYSRTHDRVARTVTTLLSTFEFKYNDENDDPCATWLFYDGRQRGDTRTPKWTYLTLTLEYSEETFSLTVEGCIDEKNAKYTRASVTIFVKRKRIWCEVSGKRSDAFHEDYFKNVLKEEGRHTITFDEAQQHIVSIAITIAAKQGIPRRKRR